MNDSGVTSYQLGLAGGPIYLDYNTTTPVDPPVGRDREPYLTAHFGNPSNGGELRYPRSGVRKRNWRTHAGRFGRRLQLDPGLVPPASWSHSPASPLLNCRADLAKSPGSGAIYLKQIRSARNLAIYVLIAAWPSCGENRIRVRMIYAGSRSEWVQRRRSPRSRPSRRGRISRMVSRRHARLVAQRAREMVRPGTRSRRPSTVDQSI